MLKQREHLWSRQIEHFAVNNGEELNYFQQTLHNVEAVHELSEQNNLIDC